MKFIQTIIVFNDYFSKTSKRYFLTASAAYSIFGTDMVISFSSKLIKRVMSARFFATIKAGVVCTVCMISSDTSLSCNPPATYIASKSLIFNFVSNFRNIVLSQITILVVSETDNISMYVRIFSSISADNC